MYKKTVLPESRWNEILESAGNCIKIDKGSESVFGFINKHRSFYRVKEMCCILGVARQGFYRWFKSPEGIRKKEDKRLLPEMRNIFMENRQIYGL